MHPRILTTIRSKPGIRAVGILGVDKCRSNRVIGVLLDREQADQADDNGRAGKPPRRGPARVADDTVQKWREQPRDQ